MSVKNDKTKYISCFKPLTHVHLHVSLCTCTRYIGSPNPGQIPLPMTMYNTGILHAKYTRQMM